jgi:hypothetical protein
MVPPKAKALRSVKPNERHEPPAEAPRVMTISEAADAGDRLAELSAMRRRLAQALEDPNTPARDLAALSRRQLEIGREIDAMKAAADREATVDHRATEAEDWDEAAI